MGPSQASATVMEQVRRRRPQLAAILTKYDATEPLIFGSVARGEATTASDLDIMVTLAPDRGNPWMRLAGLTDEFSAILGLRVDVVSPSVLRTEVSQQARREAVPL